MSEFDCDITCKVLGFRFIFLCSSINTPTQSLILILMRKKDFNYIGLDKITKVILGLKINLTNYLKQRAASSWRE
jgi:hypothetical protein